MTIQELGAIGELIGGIAVILSVLYLALQIRHGLVGYRSTVTQEVTNHFSRIQLEIAGNQELFGIWSRAQRGEHLSEEETGRAQQILSSYLIGFENLYFQLKNGMFDKDAYNARRRILGSMMSSPTAQGWWNGLGRKMHPDEFVNEVDAAVVDYLNRKPE